MTVAFFPDAYLRHHLGGTGDLIKDTDRLRRLMNDLDINIGSRCAGRLIIAAANNPTGKEKTSAGTWPGRLVA